MVGWSCLPTGEWPNGWWDVRTLRVIGDDGSRQKSLIQEIQPDLFERPVRKVRPGEDRGVVTFRVERGLHVLRDALDPALLNKLRDQFTYKNPDHAKKLRLGKWIGDTPKEVKSFEDLGDELVFPRGGTNKVRKVFRMLNREVEFEDERHDPEDSLGVIELGPRAEPATMRSDQEMLIEAILKAENCLIRAATGSGKTEVAIELIRRLDRPTLVVVWSSALVRGNDGWIARLCQRFGWKEDQVGLVGDGTWRVRPVTVGMLQTVRNHVEKLSSIFSVVIADEVQRFSAPTFREVIGRFPARYRVGVSADERRKDRMEALTQDAFGEVVAEVGREELIARGELCEVEIVVVPTEFRFPAIENAPPEERGRTVGREWGNFLDASSSDEERNRIAVRVAVEELENSQSVILFVDRTDHARDLTRRISIHHEIPCGICLGGPDNKKVLDETLNRLRDGSLHAAVGTSCIYQGINVKRLAVGVVTIPAANNRQMFEQMCGRLRRKFPGKVRGVLYYLWDSHVFPSHPANLRKWYGKWLVRVLGV